MYLHIQMLSEMEAQDLELRGAVRGNLDALIIEEMSVCPEAERVQQPEHAGLPSGHHHSPALRTVDHPAESVL